MRPCTKPPNDVLLNTYPGQSSILNTDYNAGWH